MIRFTCSTLALAGALFYANAATAQTSTSDAGDTTDGAETIVVTAATWDTRIEDSGMVFFSRFEG